MIQRTQFVLFLQDLWKTNGGSNSSAKRDQTRNSNTRLLVDLQPAPAINPPDEGRYLKQSCQKDIRSLGALQVSASSSFAWAKKPKEGRSYINSHSRFSSRSHISGAPDCSNILRTKIPSDLKGQANRDIGHVPYLNSNNGRQHEIAKHEMLTQWSQSEFPEQYEIAKHAIMNQWSHPVKPDSFNSCDSYHSQDLLDALYKRDAKSTKHSILVLVQLTYLFFPYYTVNISRNLTVHLKNLRSTRIEETELSSLGLYFLRLIRLTNFYRSMNGISAKLFADHGSRKVKVKSHFKRHL